jgi:hypothetical protein
MPYPTTSSDFIYITEDPVAARKVLLPHWTHSGKMYDRWAEENGQKVCDRFPTAMTVEEFAQNPIYKVMTPEECIAYVESLGENADLRFQPMPGGLNPAFAWKSLQLFEKKVLPHIKVKRIANVLY